MATYYIATTGNDTTGDGSSSNPWLTLSKFLTSSEDNDTLIVKDGTYTLTSNETISQRTIQAENNGLAIFDGGNSEIRFNIGGNNTFEGLIFQRFYGLTNNRIGIFTYDTTFGTTTYNNCTFTNNRLGYSTSQVRGPMFYSNSGTSGDEGIFIFNSCLWYSNYVSQSGGNRSCYFGAIGGTNCPMNATLRNCTFVNNITDGTDVNLLCYTQSANGMNNITITNCIIYNSSGTTFNISYNDATFQNFTTSHSDYYNISDPHSPTILSGTGVITSDPLFIDAANNNYNLSPTSPCIDTGTLI